MIKHGITLAILLSVCPTLFAEDLVGVYRDAVQSDPTFKAAYAARVAAEEAFPQGFSRLLPQVAFQSSASVSSRPESIPGSSLTTRAIGYRVNLTQPIFHFSDWANLRAAKATTRAAVASYFAAQQALIARTVSAYLNVLQAEDVLRVDRAEKEAYRRTYDEVKQQHAVGLKTKTDVYTARAAYDRAVSECLGAEYAVLNSREDLRSITNRSYPVLAPLKSDMSFVRPDPINVTAWVTQATAQNWSLRASQAEADVSREQIAIARGNRMLTLDVGTTYEYEAVKVSSVGTETAHGSGASLNLNIPVFTGGVLTSLVRQAMAHYQGAMANREAVYRSVINATRKAYLGIFSDISALQAAHQAVVSQRSALEGIRAGYRVGLQTMTNVLSAEQALYAAERDEAISRYQYVSHWTALKEAIGTLSEADLVGLTGVVSKG